VKASEQLCHYTFIEGHKKTQYEFHLSILRGIRLLLFSYVRDINDTQKQARYWQAITRLGETEIALVPDGIFDLSDQEELNELARANYHVSCGYYELYRDYAVAMETIETAINLNPHEQTYYEQLYCAYRAKAIEYINTKDLENADKFLALAGQKPLLNKGSLNGGELLFYQGIVLFLRGNINEARAILEDVFARYDQEKLAALYRSIKRGLLRDFLATIVSDRNVNIEIRSALARMLKTEERIYAPRIALTLIPHITRAFEICDYETARNEVALARELDRTNKEILAYEQTMNNIARSLRSGNRALEAGNLQKALQLYKRAFAYNTNDSSLKAKVDATQKKIEISKKEFVKLSEAKTALMVARNQEQGGKYPQAYANFEKAQIILQTVSAEVTNDSVALLKTEAKEGMARTADKERITIRNDLEDDPEDVPQETTSSTEEITKKSPAPEVHTRTITVKFAKKLHGKKLPRKNKVIHDAFRKLIQKNNYKPLAMAGFYKPLQQYKLYTMRVGNNRFIYYRVSDNKILVLDYGNKKHYSNKKIVQRVGPMLQRLDEEWNQSEQFGTYIVEKINTKIDHSLKAFVGPIAAFGALWFDLPIAAKIIAVASIGYLGWILVQTIGNLPKVFTVINEAGKTTIVEFSKILAPRLRLMPSLKFIPTHDKVLSFLKRNETVLIFDVHDDRTQGAHKAMRDGVDFDENEANWVIKGEATGKIYDWSLFHPEWLLRDVPDQLIQGPRPHRSIKDFEEVVKNITGPVTVTICLDYLLNKGDKAIDHDYNIHIVAQRPTAPIEILYSEVRQIFDILNEQDINVKQIVCAESANYCPPEKIPTLKRIIKKAHSDAFGQKSSKKDTALTINSLAGPIAAFGALALGLPLAAKIIAFVSSVYLGWVLVQSIHKSLSGPHSRTDAINQAHTIARQIWNGDIKPVWGENIDIATFRALCDEFQSEGEKLEAAGKPKWGGTSEKLTAIIYEMILNGAEQSKRFPDLDFEEIRKLFNMNLRELIVSFPQFLKTLFEDTAMSKRKREQWRDLLIFYMQRVILFEYFAYRNEDKYGFDSSNIFSARIRDTILNITTFIDVPDEYNLLVKQSRIDIQYAQRVSQHLGVFWHSWDTGDYDHAAWLWKDLQYQAPLYFDMLRRYIEKLKDEENEAAIQFLLRDDLEVQDEQKVMRSIKPFSGSIELIDITPFIYRNLNTTMDEYVAKMEKVPFKSQEISREFVKKAKEDDVTFARGKIEAYQNETKRLLKRKIINRALFGFAISGIGLWALMPLMPKTFELASVVIVSMLAIMGICMLFIVNVLNLTDWQDGRDATTRRLEAELRLRDPESIQVKKGKGKMKMYEKPKSQIYPSLEEGGVIYKPEPEHDPLSQRDIYDLEIKSRSPFSLLFYFNRTKTFLGLKRLTRLLTHPILDPLEIRERQNVTRFLMQKEDLRRSLQDALHDVNDNTVFKIAKRKPDFGKCAIMVSVYLGLMTGCSFINFYLLVPFIFIGAIKYLHYVSPMVDDKEALLKYVDSVLEIENIIRSFPTYQEVPLLKEIVDCISALHDPKHPHSVQKDLKKRGLWEMRNLLKEKEKDFLRIMGAIAELDAFTSIAQSAIDHEVSTFPKVLDQENPYVSITNGVHPMYALRDGIQPNSIVFDPETHQFYIVTGPNMSGKSTLLKMIALNILGAQVGGPVFAEGMEWTPIRLRTHINIEDSLAEDMSRFDVETDRMLDHTRAAILDPKTLYLLIGDEMYEGTEPSDRLDIQKATLTYLYKHGVFGIFATHDLGLSEFAEEYPRMVNIHFSEKVVGAEAIRDYLLEKGAISRDDTNAIDVLRRKGFPSEISEAAIAYRAERGAKKSRITILDVKQLQKSYESEALMPMSIESLREFDETGSLKSQLRHLVQLKKEYLRALRARLRFSI